MRIVVDIFSGRPNPSWLLGEDEAARVVAVVRRHARTSRPSKRPDGLGYRGFAVSLEAGELDPWRELIVYHDTVQARGESGGTTLHDSSCAVETTLVRLAHEHDPAMAALVARVMNQS